MRNFICYWEKHSDHTRVMYSEEAQVTCCSYGKEWSWNLGNGGFIIGWSGSKRSGGVVQVSSGSKFYCLSRQNNIFTCSQWRRKISWHQCHHHVVISWWSCPLECFKGRGITRVVSSTLSKSAIDVTHIFSSINPLSSSKCVTCWYLQESSLFRCCNIRSRIIINGDVKWWYNLLSRGPGWKHSWSFVPLESRVRRWLVGGTWSYWKCQWLSEDGEWTCLS